MRVELPPEPVYFVNRDDERERALRAVTEWRSSSRPLVLALSGPGGLGKTELAGLIARTLLDRYPFTDGVLSVDLDDFRADGVLDPGDVLSQLLHSLDVAPDQVQPQYAARCRQYWNRTSDAKLVLLLDNARYASEVVPLLPASGGSVVIVTSHGPLHDLEAGAAVDLALPPLEERAAMELLELIVRDHRLAADPQAARAVVRLCDGLPAALHVAGRWVRTHRLRPLSRILADLQAELDEKGVSGVEHIWDTACADLSRPAALLYRLLPHHPGETFTLHSATALSGLGPEACQDALEELDRAGLLDLRLLSLTVAGQMRLPGPQRGHALRWSRREAGDIGGVVAEAQARLLRWLVRQAQLADRFAAGRRLTVVDLFDPVPGVPDVPLEDPEGPWTTHHGLNGQNVRRAGWTRSAMCCSRARVWPMAVGWTPRSLPCPSPCGRMPWTVPISPRSSRFSGVPSTRRAGTVGTPGGWCARAVSWPGHCGSRRS
ncbi:NB-ARC domain-containing protein [Streptomyces sp. A30]|uniref:NB-ARC domain-containing protein n=1 Tax=Streptomyces sp. A30 TaxID=2789273 RepID=UPI003980A3AB